MTMLKISLFLQDTKLSRYFYPKIVLEFLSLHFEWYRNESPEFQVLKPNLEHLPNNM